MCVYACVRACVCMCACAYAYARARARVRVCSRARVCMCLCVYVGVRAHVRMCAHVGIWESVVHACVRVRCWLGGCGVCLRIYSSINDKLYISTYDRVHRCSQLLKIVAIQQRPFSLAFLRIEFDPSDVTGLAVFSGPCPSVFYE